MAPNKTKPTSKAVSLFLNGIQDEQKRKDSWTILKMMEAITQEQPIIWGTSIIGFGTYHYKYKSGREGDWFLTGFSPRKAAFSIYLMCDLSHSKLNFNGLGKHKRGKGCLYVKKLSDVNIEVLDRLITDSIGIIKELY